MGTWKDGRGSSPLLLATYYGSEEVTTAILGHPQDIDAQDAVGNTALMGYASKGFKLLHNYFWMLEQIPIKQISMGLQP